MRDWITKDFGWKLFSVFLAVAIWLTVHKVREDPLPISPTAGNTATYGSVPVQVVSAAADVRDFRALPGSVSVQVSGSPKILATLQANQIHVVVDLTGITNTASSSRLDVQVFTPPGVMLVSVEPAEVGLLIPPVKEIKP
jgi:YbbR domain-containing protein